jgi:hypothetical protein
LVIEWKKRLAADKFPGESSHQKWIEEESPAETVEVIREEKAAARKTEARASAKFEPGPGTQSRNLSPKGKSLMGQ